MRIKVGDTWYEPEKGQPIMVELMPKDRENIKNMAPGFTCYAVFTDDDELTNEQKLEWMNEGR